MIFSNQVVADETRATNIIDTHLNHLKVVRHYLKDSHEVMDAVALPVLDEVSLHGITTEDDA